VRTIRTVAFYLPQFHPVSENDAWWGPGFTDWINVAKATPRFRGHYQPHIPRDLGLYDLRLPAVQEAQAELAATYGVGGFCYYDYWFGGRRLLERPLDTMLRGGTPNFPFMLCWANENWTRRWDGHDADVLMQQVYSAADDVAHAHFLADVASDPRYIRVADRPVVAVYRVALLPTPSGSPTRGGRCSPSAACRTRCSAASSRKATSMSIPGPMDSTPRSNFNLTGRRWVNPFVVVVGRARARPIDC
jgi:hypothetical protein